MAAFLKFVMFTFNFIFWAIGATMLGIGIWLAVDPNAYEVLKIASSAGMNDSVWATAVYTTIAVSAFLFLIGFLGCWGSLGTGRRSALMAYSALVMLVLLAELVIFILILVFYGEISGSVEKEMANDVKHKYNQTTEESLTKLWDNMQSDWKCCGSYNYTDYVNSYFTNNTNYAVPQSCCKGKESEDYRKCLNEAILKSSKKYEYLNEKGCYQGMEDFLSRNAAILIGITCGFAGLQIIGLVIACCLMKRDNRAKEYA